MTSESSDRGGWRIARSIAIELDLANYLGRMGPDVLPDVHADLAARIPPAWFDEFDSLSAKAGPDRGLQSIVEPLARWADVLEVEDYDTASAAMREITSDDAVAQIKATSDIVPAPDLDGPDQLIDMHRRLEAELAAQAGTYPPSDATIVERKDHAIVVAVGALRDGPLHGRFWHWLDRFYYEAYRPWRATRRSTIEMLEQTALDALGADHGAAPPNLEWLEPSNPIRTTPTVLDAVTAGELSVVFLAEPFGLSDTWTLAPGLVLTSFAKRGDLYQHYNDYRHELTTRLKALADPTRMSILRIIRMLDVDNTQLAGHIDVSRPTISVHAKILADAGLITTTREGRQARHTFHPDTIKQLCDDLLRFLDIGSAAGSGDI